MIEMFWFFFANDNRNVCQSLYFFSQCTDLNKYQLKIYQFTRAKSTFLEWAGFA
jgi:hypothetical protein